MTLMSNVKNIVRQQYGRMLDKAATRFSGLDRPRDGWLCALRKALAMSAPVLARRVGVTKAAIYQAERMEREGRVTIAQMEKIAGAMGGRFVYAVVPDGTVRDILEAQAREKARTLIKRVSAHMALEDQSLSLERIDDEIDLLAAELLRDMPSDFWK